MQAGPAPDARAGATLSLWRDEAIVVFGGRSAAGLRNDAWVLDFPEDDESAMRWRPVAVADDAPLPPARDGHAAVVVGDRLLVLGGAGDGGAGALCPPDAVEVLDNG